MNELEFIGLIANLMGIIMFMYFLCSKIYGEDDKKNSHGLQLICTVYDIFAASACMQRKFLISSSLQDIM